MAKKENLNPLAGLALGVQQAQESAAVSVPQKDEQPLQEEKRDTLHNTQGRKGHKLPRINMAFTPENHAFVKRTSRQMGISATEYVNNLIDEARIKVY